jgi:WD40 repeat protein
LAFSQDGSVLYLAAADTLRAIELGSGDEVWAYTPPRSFGFLIISPLWLSTSSQGDVAAAFDNGSIAVWSQEGILKSLWHHNDAPRMLDFDFQGRLLIGTDSFSLTGWDWQTRKRAFKMPMPARVYGLAVSPLVPIAATRTLHGIHLWDLEQENAIGSMPVGFGLPLLAFSPAQPLMAYTERHSVLLCDLEGHIVDQRPVQGAAIVSLSFAPDGKEIAVGCTDNQVRQWRL